MQKAKICGGLLWVLGIALAWCSQGAAETVTIYRDTWGVPNIYGDSEEAVCYALGYAEAEDRPEQIFDNYRWAIGRQAETAGPQALEDDYWTRVFRTPEVSQERWSQVTPKVRGCMTAFQAGIRRYFQEHPERKPDNYLEIEPWMCIAVSRAVIWGWPLGEMADDLEASGIKPPKIAYHGSNEMALAPSKTQAGVPIAVIDPHLGFYGPFRFYEVRMYGGKFSLAGVAIVGLPFITLGHNASVSVAMTTGGPDTADVFQETLNPDNPNQYRYDGAWRDGIRRTITIQVKDPQDGTLQPYTREILYTHHGPVVGEKDGFGYAGALAYADEVGLCDQMYRMMTSKNLKEMQDALAMAQLMSQNVMVTTVDGEIYYQRTGRVPIRPAGYDYNKAVDGSTSKTEWQGIHPTSDLPQVTNPACGWMQNCNCSPRVMFPNSPMTPDKYASYLYFEPNLKGYVYGLHQRAHGVYDLLNAVTKASADDVKEIAFSPQVEGVKPWQERLQAAWDKADAATKEKSELARFVQAILSWDGRVTKDSTGALPYRYFKDALEPKHYKDAKYPKEVLESINDLVNKVGLPPDPSLSDASVLEMVQKGYAKMLKEEGRIDVPFGEAYRCGRKRGYRTVPAEGGTIKGIACPRAMGFPNEIHDGYRLMHSGQCAPQVVLMTRPPQSWTAAPLGQSDDLHSPHFDDQAIELVGQRKMKSTYFQDKATLLKNLESQKELSYEASAK